MPPELVLMVVESLPMPDIMSLRLSSRRFASFVQRVNKKKPTYLDTIELKDRLERDEYFKLAEAESVQVSTARGLLCSHCRKVHVVSDFDRKETAKSAHVRQCKGMTRAFRTCSHGTRTRDEVLGYEAIGWITEGSVPQVCSTCWSPPSLFKSQASKDVIFYSYHKLRTYQPHDVIYRFEILLGLRRLATHICPHMRSDDEDFQNRVRCNPLGNKWFFKTGRPEDWDNGEPVDDRFAEPHMDARMRICCREQHCDSSIEIERFHSMGGMRMAILITIRRNLGKMESPLDPVWLAQLEPELRE
jgi:hypothetical protein